MHLHQLWNNSNGTARIRRCPIMLSQTHKLSGLTLTPCMLILCCRLANTTCMRVPKTAMPCHAMPCHAMPCHAMQCNAMQWPWFDFSASKALLGCLSKEVSRIPEQQAWCRHELYTKQHMCEISGRAPVERGSWQIGRCCLQAHGLGHSHKCPQ